MGGSEELDDVERLEAEFAATGWTIGKRDITANSGPDRVTLIAWRGDVRLTAQTFDGMRRAIRAAGG